MTYEKGSKPKGETKIVDWFLVKKEMIKFLGDEDSLTVADNVMQKSNFEKYPILKGDTVEVTIKDDQVVFLRKIKGVKKAQSKSTTSDNTNITGDNGDSETKTVTIFAVAGNKKVVKFSKEGSWISVSEELQTKDYQTIGLVAKNEVSVQMQGDTIVDIQLVAQKEEKAEIASSSISKKSSYRDEESVDKRTAAMNAKDLAISLVKVGAIKDTDKLKTVMSDLIKSCYNDIVNL